MALMAFREPNQVKWVGVRPAHRGTQIVKEGYADGALVIVWTVTVGKTGFLATVILNAAGLPGVGTLYVRNAADVYQYSILWGGILTAVGSVMPASASFNPPLEIPAEWDVVMISSAVGFACAGFVFGWEE